MTAATIPVFIGYDPRETAAFHVLAHTLIEGAGRPVSITAIGNTTLDHNDWSRPRGKYDSTEFSTARFMVPYLMGYQGFAIYLDCDMLLNGSLLELWDQCDRAYAVQVVRHQYVPTAERKFLGARQIGYSRKNWSSLMIFNCGHQSTQRLTKEYVNAAPGLDLHGFAWCAPGEIGGIGAGAWNTLSTATGLEHPSGVPEAPHKAELLHFTEGGPWHGVRTPGWELWFQALAELLAQENSHAAVDDFVDEEHSALTVEYHIRGGEGDGETV